MTLAPDNFFADLVPAGPTYGPPPKPREPDKPREPPTGYRWGPGGPNTTLERIPGYKGEGELNDPQQQIIKDAISGLGVDELLTGVKRARKQVETGWATGIPGALGGLVPGSTRNNFRAMLDQIQGGIILEKLQTLKDASKTGASGMGALSEREGARLAAAVAALSENMSADELERSFQEIERHARTLQAVRDGKDPTDPAVAKQYAINGTPEDRKDTTKPGGATDPNGGGDGPPGVSQLTPEQARSYEAFIAANDGKPSAAQIATFLGKLLGKTPANVEDIAKSLASGRGFSTTVEDRTRREKVDRQLKREDALGLGGKSAEVLVRQGATLNLSDEAAGIGNAAANILTAPFTGSFDPVEAYGVGRDTERQRIANARQQLGYGGTALEFAGALASFNPAAAAATITPRAAIGSGAAGGALSGFGAGEGTEQSLVGAGAGATAGAAVSVLAPFAINRIAARGLPSDPRLANAASAEQVRISAPMVEGNRKAVIRAGRLEAGPQADVIQQGLANTAEDIEGGVTRLGGGQPQDRAAMGETLRQAAKDIQRVDREGATSAYGALDDTIPVDPIDMRARIDAKLAQLQRRPNQNREQIRELQRYRADLDGPLPLSEIRAMRTDARDNIAGGNIARSASAKKADRFMMQTIDSANKDIERALPPDALAAWKQADAEFRENQTLYRQALKPFFGDDFDKLPAEQIFDKVKAAANSNGRALAGFHRRLTTEQSRDFAATIAEGLGRRSPEDPFSPALYIQQARKFSPSARETIFGPSGKASFDNLLLLSRRLERAKSEINRSKTARPTMALIRQQATNFLTVLLGGAGLVHAGPTGAAVGGGMGMAAKAGLDAIGNIRAGLSARALMNPRVTRWMADAADASTPRQAKELAARLGGIIAREPLIANDLQPIYDFLQKRVTPALAAEPDGNDDDQR